MEKREAEIVLQALNLYARKKGYNSWRDFCRLKDTCPDFPMFAEILIKKLKSSRGRDTG